MVKMPMLTLQIYILQTYVYFFYISVLFYHCDKKEANVLKTLDSNKTVDDLKSLNSSPGKPYPISL